MSKAWKCVAPETLENRQVLSVLPNDSLINSQANLKNISAADAWSYTVGSRNVVVAVIDSGIDLNHNDLKNNIWVNKGEVPNDGIDNEGNGYIDDVNGWNFYDNTNNVQDGFGHGTHVAGIIGAEGSNSMGVAGVNWTVSIMPLKFMSDTGYANTGGAIDAMSYILKMKREYGVNVVAVNNSWGGGTGFSISLDSKIQELNDAGVVCVTAAGNAGVDSDASPRYPGSFNRDNIINVAALSYDGINLASYSNYGVNNVDIAAPGSALSTLPGNYYGYKTGTSMAAPHVAGAVALLKSIKPDMTIPEIKNTIFSSVDMVGSLFNKVASHGKLNVGAAVCRALNVPYSANIMPEGGIYSSSMSGISGWVKEVDSMADSTLVKLVINGTEQARVLVGAHGNWSFKLDTLCVGNNDIKIYAQDSKSQEWIEIASTAINLPSPVVSINLKPQKVWGWAYSIPSGSSPVVVKVTINDKLVASQLANKYKPGLYSPTGSKNHGFSISLNKKWYRGGANQIIISVFDPISKQTTVVWQGYVRR